jgi:hypothetical protein
MYQWQAITEYGHKLYENLFGQMSYTYRAYRGDDTHLAAPGLIYYLGDSYMSASYGASYMENHDTANVGVFKGDFAITKFLHWNCGMAVGGRLYDINGLDAADEFGYILPKSKFKVRILLWYRRTQVHKAERKFRRIGQILNVRLLRRYSLDN